MTPGDRLRTTRKERGLSPTELGKRAAQYMGRDRPLTASAVRNQENGTNGIPLDVAIAYARVLEVNPVWLVFGEVSNDPINAKRIPLFSTVSGQWHNPTVPPDEMDGGRAVSVEYPGFDIDGAVAYEVFDNSLEPIFSQGDYLIAVQVEKTVVEGDIVLVYGDFVNARLVAVRRVLGKADNFALGSVGDFPFPPLTLEEQEAAGLDTRHRVVAAIRKFRDKSVPEHN